MIKKLEETGGLKQTEVRRRLFDIEREISHLGRNQQVYTKNMARFGVAAWDLGLLFFFFSTMTMNLPLYGTESIWVPLLVVSLAVPILLSAVFSYKFVFRIKRLRRIRRDLLKRHQINLFHQVENIFTETWSRFKTPRKNQ